MSIATWVPEPNIWDEICKDFSQFRPPFKEDDTESCATVRENYDPAKVTPVVFGKLGAKIVSDENPVADFDPAISHPACVGYAFVDKPSPCRPATPPELPDKKTCSPREYLDTYVFPILLPALEEMLRTAKTEKCFERKRTKFNACDFLTEYLYRQNKSHEGRDEVLLWDIPFVKEWLKDHPRPPLPKSLLWTEEEATLIIQSYWRGYLVRKQTEVSELRQWQKQWREENENINKKVDNFWAQQMPEPTPANSEEQIGQQQEAQQPSSPKE